MKIARVLAVAPTPKATSQHDSLLYVQHDSVLDHFVKYGYRYLAAIVDDMQHQLTFLGAKVRGIRWEIMTYEEDK